MSRLVTLLLPLLLAAPAVVSAQEDPGPVETESAAPATDGAAAQPDDEPSDEELPDDADLDEQTYEDNEDVFVPTEEIPADEPIPFPTDI